MSVRSQIIGLVASVLHKRKASKQLKKTRRFVETELAQISKLPEVDSPKSGTVLIKCDDIGDFLVWQQVIETIKSKENPVYFVANKVIKSLYEAYFDFADKVIWIDKSRWNDADYRLETYTQIRSLNADRAIGALFTRNYNLDDLLLVASGAHETIAWDRHLHTYFPGFDLFDPYITRNITSDKAVQLEYYRNIEFVSKIYGIPENLNFKVLFPQFKRHNTLAVVPVASAGSKTWEASKFAACIKLVLPLFERVILIGGKNGEEIAKHISESVDDAKLINLVNQTKLNELFAFVGEARLLLTLDTFAAHIGPLCGTDTVVVANGTNWQRFGDYEGKVPSRYKLILPPDFKKEYNKVKTSYSGLEIQSIEVETVGNAIRSMIQHLP